MGWVGLGWVDGCEDMLLQIFCSSGLDALCGLACLEGSRDGRGWAFSLVLYCTESVYFGGGEGGKWKWEWEWFGCGERGKRGSTPSQMGMDSKDN